MWVLTLSSAAKRSCLCWHRLLNAGIYVVFTVHMLMLSAALNHECIFGCKAWFSVVFSCRTRMRSGLRAPIPSGHSDTRLSPCRWRGVVFLRQERLQQKRHRKVHQRGNTVNCILSQRLPSAACCHSACHWLHPVTHCVCHWLRPVTASAIGLKRIL